MTEKILRFVLVILYVVSLVLAWNWGYMNGSNHNARGAQQTETVKRVWL